jgi:hypothetical protein
VLDARKSNRVSELCWADHGQKKKNKEQSMRASQGYRLPAKASKKKPRPAGVAFMAILGVLGSFLAIIFTLVRIWNATRLSVQPSATIGALAVGLLAAIVLLWINWGFWEQVRWAWWANVLVSLVSVVVFIVALRNVPELVKAVAQLWRGLDERQLTTGVIGALLAGLIYNLIGLVYMFSAHAAFEVGVKDERPVWERIARN